MLSAVLALTGAAFILIGLNTALGGLLTLGWQFPTDVLTVTDPDNFARHDSNARFFAGIFVGVGGVTLLAARWTKPLRLVIAVFMLSIALGGLFRLFQTGFSPLLDSAVLPSLIAELILAPLLALWTMRATQ